MAKHSESVRVLVSRARLLRAHQHCNLPVSGSPKDTFTLVRRPLSGRVLRRIDQSVRSSSSAHLRSANRSIHDGLVRQAQFSVRSRNPIHLHRLFHAHAPRLLSALVSGRYVGCRCLHVTRAVGSSFRVGRRNRLRSGLHSLLPSVWAAVLHQ